MFKKIKMKLASLLYNFIEHNREFDSPNIGCCDKVSTAIPRSNTGLNSRVNRFSFNLVPINGGYVVEFNKYTDDYDRTSTQLHFISNESDFNAGLAGIVALEMLRS